MTLKVKDTGGADFEPLEAGTHTAICTQIIDVGPQMTNFGQKDLVYLRFEIPGERVEWKDSDGNDREGSAIIWANYTASLAEKAKLRQHLEAWRGLKFTDEELGGFDMKKLLGVPCTLTVVHREGKNGKVYANVGGISKVMKGIEAPKAEGDLFAFDIEDHTGAEYKKLPDWLRKKVDYGLQCLREQRGQGGFRNQPADVPPPDSEGFVDDDLSDLPF